MAQPVCPDISVYVCHNCTPPGVRLPRQWTEDGAHVVVKIIPCSGKLDVQYLFHAFEGGVRGLVVAACPRGGCRLAQGNYRAEVRMRTTQRLLAEVGIEEGRAELVHASTEDSPEQFEKLVRDAVKRVCQRGDSPLHPKR